MSKKCYEEKLCRSSTLELLKIILMQSENPDEFDKEAIKSFNDEFERRKTEFQNLLKDHYVKTGFVEYAIYGKNISLYDERWGNIYFSSNGIFFIPRKIVPLSKSNNNANFTYGIGASQLGAFGLIFDEIFKSISESIQGKEKIISTTKIHNINLPLSLLTDILDHSWNIMNYEIYKMVYKKNGEMTIETNDRTSINIIVDKSEILQIISWFEKYNLRYIQKKSIFEILKEMIIK